MSKIQWESYQLTLTDSADIRKQSGKRFSYITADCNIIQKPRNFKDNIFINNITQFNHLDFHRFENSRKNDV